LCDIEMPVGCLKAPGVCPQLRTRVFRHRRPKVGGQVIRTTDEHPFYLRGRGWTATKDLMPGDHLRSHDGQWTVVQEVRDSGEDGAVYNLRISDYHTYFVGSEEWGFSVWAHNACIDPGSRCPVGQPGWTTDKR
jgi:hypothetical protein